MPDKLPMDAVSVAARHARIRAMKLAARTWDEIAAEVGMSARGCQEAYYTWRDADKLELRQLAQEDPLEMVHEHIAGFQAIRRELGICADESTNESAKVGALKAIADLRQKEIDLLQAVGMLPKNLGRFAIDIDMRFIESKLVELIRALEVSDEAKAVFAESIIDALNPGRRHAVIEAAPATPTT